MSSTKIQTMFGRGAAAEALPGTAAQAASARAKSVRADGGFGLVLSGKITAGAIDFKTSKGRCGSSNGASGFSF
jgi:hypothetical protein